MLIATIISFTMSIQDPEVRIAIQLIASLGAFMGVINTVLSANGSIWTFIFGVVQVTLATIVYFDKGYFGQFALHAFYFLPMQFIGFYKWYKRGATVSYVETDEGTRETRKVAAKRFSRKQWWQTIGLGLIITGVSYAILYEVDLHAGVQVDRAKLLLDSSIVAMNIVGQFLMSYAYMEQWWFWIAVNVLSIGLWTRDLMLPTATSYSLVMLMMYIFYFLNSLNGLRIWLRLSKPDTK